jgi:hypothetical protein
VTDFRELIEPGDLSPDEEARLRRVHDLLQMAGPPPDLPPALLEPPAGPVEADVVQFPLLPRRRLALAGLVAATLVAIAFGGGYLFGHAKGRPAAFAPTAVVPMHGHAANAVLRIASRDSAGNWPMQMEVSGLPQQHDRDAYYELWLTRGGRPVEPCGQFRVHDKTTRLRFSVPWRAGGIDGWVVTEQQPETQGPGPVVLST